MTVIGIARLVVGRAAMDDADAQVVLAHIDDAQLAVGRIGRRVLQDVVDLGLRDVERDRRRGADLGRRGGGILGERDVLHAGHASKTNRTLPMIRFMICSFELRFTIISVGPGLQARPQAGRPEGRPQQVMLKRALCCTSWVRVAGLYGKGARR